MTKRGGGLGRVCGVGAGGGGRCPLAAGPPRRPLRFCGFYVAGTDTSLHNEATTVVLMRDGNRTILSMQNDYQGPPEGFAMVIPVPVVLDEDDVRTLDRATSSRGSSA
jgi:hypothetical protein